jgi:hypothetical protein
LPGNIGETGIQHSSREHGAVTLHKTVRVALATATTFNFAVISACSPAVLQLLSLEADHT